MTRYTCNSGGILSVGYDAQCAMLEIEFADTGGIWQFAGVPEEIWYLLRSQPSPEHYFQYFIMGNYLETRI